MAQPTLVLIRPEAQACAFAEQVRARVPEARIVISPLLRIESTRPRTIPQADALIFTSQNAVTEYTALAPALGRPAWCVGARTAAAAQAAGYQARVAGPDAAHLIRSIRAKAPSGRLLHPTGRHRRGDVALRLAQSGFDAREIVVYDQLEQPLSEVARGLLGSDAPALVPLFSPRSAAVFSRQAGDCPHARLICMSPAVADELRIGHAGIFTINTPTGQNMLKAVSDGLTGRLSP